MNIVLHGATNYGSTNYGDFIYAKEVYEYIRDRLKEQDNVFFYNSSPFFNKYLELNDKKGYREKFDTLIYIPGGYFIQNSNKIKSIIFRIKRYFPVWFKAVFAKKEYILLGLGVGPINSFILENLISNVIKGAYGVSVRDRFSYDTVRRISNVSAMEFGDMILSFDMNNLRKKSYEIDRIIEESTGKKIVLIHYNHDEKILKLFSDMINLLDEEYYFIVTSDCFVENENILFDRFKKSVKHIVIHYQYDNPYEFTELLANCDMILTCKLHAGVVASMFNKSVFCAAIHYEKTVRFYEEINRIDCVVDSTDISPLQLKEKFYHSLDNPIFISENTIAKANGHKQFLENFLREINHEQKIDE